MGVTNVLFVTAHDYCAFATASCTMTTDFLLYLVIISATPITCCVLPQRLKDGQKEVEDQAREELQQWPQKIRAAG